MRLLSFIENGRSAPGVRIGEEVVPVSALAGFPDDALALIGMGAEGLAKLAAAAAAAPASARRKLSDLTLGMPIPRPGKVACIGLNYALHAKEGGNPIPDYPAMFLRVQTSLVGPDQPMLRPKVSDKFDYEAELAIIIGKRARCVSQADALDYVAGYSLFNDGSIRDYQRKSTQWTMGKNFDATGAFGPEIVTADELPPGAAPLRICARVDGQTVQDSTTGDMIFSVARAIEIISEVMTLEPGDVIATGTPSGVGYARKPPLFLAPGKVVEIEVEGIGVLRNTIADDPAFG
ncbi:fumarylacetoacetate hydrolase family protein [Falsiroseomonas stagni]|uniref:2-keto-4-pentenoate hydratase/2-oxohepta-3-ene-1,7-dioic acid hydratase (Catechol pathway) n=1 Tax=Falsiroseomonas stagni DSM 19981 TaxID=1123062 RepID=A0A1I3Z1B3_9PROT|nr:fumarylacetoacetate hydrolase family protein [Falsiroseomonas stagni]SFK37898.1 2-keto-4-pentenoate hydratase/2-oxohepta-3-ene-1,7-dioic acid hydratase (catechol pathway) [Falsiroseomonas stagni DSM 19981]